MSNPVLTQAHKTYLRLKLREYEPDSRPHQDTNPASQTIVRQLQEGGLLDEGQALTEAGREAARTMLDEWVKLPFANRDAVGRLRSCLKNAFWRVNNPPPKARTPPEGDDFQKPHKKSRCLYCDQIYTLEIDNAHQCRICEGTGALPMRKLCGACAFVVERLEAFMSHPKGRDEVLRVLLGLPSPPESDPPPPTEMPVGCVG